MSSRGKDSTWVLEPSVRDDLTTGVLERVSVAITLATRSSPCVRDKPPSPATKAFAQFIREQARE